MVWMAGISLAYRGSRPVDFTGEMLQVKPITDFRNQHKQLVAPLDGDAAMHIEISGIIRVVLIYGKDHVSAAPRIT